MLLRRLRGRRAAAPRGTYDAFISYSHAADGKLAPALQRGLQRFAKPWYRPRALRIFRDQTDLSATPALWPAIQAALDRSRHFVLLGSPRAAGSPWVAREVEHWRKTKSADSLFVGLTEGDDLAWDAARGDFDWARTTAVPPALAGAFSEESLWVDLRFARGVDELSLQHPQFRDAVAALAAPLHGRTPSELASEEVRQHRRTLRIAWAAAITLLALTGVSVLFGLFALSQRNTARAQTRVALSRAVSAAAEGELRTNVDRGLLLSLEACRFSCGFETELVLYRALDLTWSMGPALRGHDSSVLNVAFSPDGKTLASSGADDGARLWDVGSRKPLRDLQRIEGQVSDLAFSPDGRLVAGGTGNGNVVVWDSQSGKIRRRIQAADDAIGSVAFSPDGSTLASNGSYSISLWDVRTGTSRALGDDSSVSCIAFSPDGRTLASGGDEGAVRLWDVRTGALVRTLRAGGTIRSLAFGPAETLASAGDAQLVELWNPSTGKLIRALPGATGALWSVVFSPDGRSVAASGDDRTVRVWATATGKQKAVSGHTGTVWSVAFSPDGTALASGSDDGTVRLWETRARQRAYVLRGHRNEVESVAFDPAGETLASGGLDGTVRLWDVRSRRQKKVLRGHRAGVQSVAFSPTKETLASGGHDGTIRLWDPRSGRQTQVLRTGTERVDSIAFSRDGESLAIAGGYDGIQVWRVRGGDPPRVLRGAGTFVSGVAFSPDGRAIAAAFSDDTVQLWDVQSAKLSYVLNAHQGEVEAVAFSADGTTLASGGDDGAARLWNLRTRTQRRAVAGSGVVWSVAFDADDETLVTADAGGVRLWNVATGRPIGSRLATAETNTFEIALSSKGQLASAMQSGAVLLYRRILPIDDAEPLYPYFCNIVRRNLTRDEWAQFLPGQRYHKTCPAYPAGT